MALSEIEKLERRYAENPQGLTFAPLAEVHRKNGDVARALELLRPGLTLHPDYIPASIVLGRCHLDLGDLASAETAFTHVLGLDGENVIALKALADITERLVRFDEAERWLRTLLAIDRSNDEARDQLGRVEAARRQAEAASSAAPDAASATISAADSAGGSIMESAADADAPAGLEPTLPGATPAAADEARAEDLALQADVASAPEPPRDAMQGWVSEADSPPAGEAVPLALEELDLSVESGQPPEGIQLEEPVMLAEPVEPLAGIVGLSDAQRDGLDAAAGHDEFRVELAEDIVLESSGGSEFQVANASEELLSGRGFGHPEPPATPVSSPLDAEVAPIEAHTAEPEAGVSPEAVSGLSPEPTTGLSPEPVADLSPEPVAGSTEATTETEPGVAHEGAAEPQAEFAAETPRVEPGPAWAAPVAEPPRPAESDLVVTESMAELLAQQGHPSEALTIYRHLVTRKPGEPRYGEKIAELERRVAEHAAPAPAAPSAPAETASPAPEPPRPAYSALETHGQSVQAFLRGVFGTRLPGAAPAGHPEPARAAASADPDGAPTRPAHDSLSLSSVFGEESTPTPPAVPATGAAGQGGVSFDEFFGGPGAASTPRPPRAPDAKSDDLDQFHAWLQNLKR